MEKGQQFQDPMRGVTSSYTAPRFAPNGSMLSGHMVTAHSSEGTPLGFIEWGHKATPHGKAVVLGQHGDSQEGVDTVFGHLWKQAGIHAESTGSSHQLDQEKGLSHYEPPFVYGADGKLI